jgi:hypothetical protein
MGPPNVYPNYGDLQKTWSQAHKDIRADHFIEVEFAKEVFATRINIYETYHTGAVTRILIKNKEQQEWVLVWASKSGAEDIQSSRVFSPELLKTSFKSNHVRLQLDTTVASSFCQLDGIGKF